jgi:hypothetical protein
MFLTLSSIDGRAVLFGDLQRAEMFSPEVSERFLAMFKQDNPKVERTAFLLRPSSSFTMQIERMIIEAAKAATNAGRIPPVRRTFRDKTTLRTWLAEALTVAEAARLDEVLANC